MGQKLIPSQYETVARAIRMEHDPKTDQIYLIFEITDEKFKQRMRKDWTQNVNLQLVEMK